MYGQEDDAMKILLRKRRVAERYDCQTTRTIDRWIKDGKLPPPTTYRGRTPLWAEDELDAFDRKATIDRASGKSSTAAATAAATAARASKPKTTAADSEVTAA
jgi:predicted DNA-binding transcriptional regulator AlpA